MDSLLSIEYACYKAIDPQLVCIYLLHLYTGIQDTQFFCNECFAYFSFFEHIYLPLAKSTYDWKRKGKKLERSSLHP